MSATLSFDDAAHQVGKALFEDEYVTELTFHESWLLYDARVIERPRLRERFFDEVSEQRGLPPPDASHTNPQLLKAFLKWRFMQWQRSEILNWFERHQIPITGTTPLDLVDEKKFEHKRRILPSRGIASELNLATSDAGKIRSSQDIQQYKDELGRPRKWDWDAALAELIRLANTPDGLTPVSSEIEKYVADWFVRQTGDHPAPSKIREKVGLVMRAISKQ